jgi:hypothetical protein
MENGAILGDDTVDEAQIASHAAKLVENPSRHEQDGDAPGPCSGDGFPDQRAHRIIARGRSVIVQREHRQFHSENLAGMTCRGQCT